MRIGPRIEVYIDPNTDSTIFLKVNDEVVWERYGMKYGEMITILNTVTDLIKTIDEQFTLVTKQRGEENEAI